MLGRAIGAEPLAQAGLGTQSDGWGQPHAAVPVRFETLLRILAEDTAAPAAPDPATRAGRP
jgi:hypothetical protein